MLLRLADTACGLTNLVGRVEHDVDGRGEQFRSIGDFVQTPFAGSPAQLGQIEREERQQRHLRNVGLGRGDADLRTAPREERPAGEPAEVRSQDVADAENGAASLFGDAHRFNRVGGLTGLRHRDDERRRIDDRIAVAKLAGEFHLHRKPDERTQQVHADEARVVGAAATGDRDLADAAQEVARDLAQFATDVHVAAFVYTSGQRLLDDVGLLEDLLEHEMLEAALLGGTGIPHHLDRLALDVIAVVVGQAITVASHDGDLALLQNNLFARVRQNRGRVRGDVRLAFADADDQRARTIAGKDQMVGIVAGDDAESVRAAHLVQRLAYRLDERRRHRAFR